MNDESDIMGLAAAYYASAKRSKQLGRRRQPIWGDLGSRGVRRVGSIDCDALLVNQSLAGFCLALERRLTSPRRSAKRRSLQLALDAEQVLAAIEGNTTARTPSGHPIPLRIIPPPAALRRLPSCL